MSEGLLDSLIIPSWSAPANVHAIQTTRLGGVSLAPYDSLNLGNHVQDNPHHVARNRQLLNSIVPKALDEISFLIPDNPPVLTAIVFANSSKTKLN